MGTVEPGLWVALGLIVVALLVTDTIAFGRGRVVSVKEAAFWSLLWVLVAVGFGVAVYIVEGAQEGSDFITAFVIARSLQVDNLFVFALIVAYFRVPGPQVSRIIFWGIVLAMVFESAVVVVGVVVLSLVHWLIYVLGAFLIFTSIKMFRQSGSEEPEEEEEQNIENIMVRWTRRFLRTTGTFMGGGFFVRREGKWYVTPAFVTLLVIAGSDLAFAVDSIPAVLAISEGVFVVVGANAFAVLGLRPLYFVLHAALKSLHYLKLALAVIIFLVGLKLLSSDVVQISSLLSLETVAAILGVAILVSIIRMRGVNRRLAAQDGSTDPGEGEGR